MCRLYGPYPFHHHGPNYFTCTLHMLLYFPYEVIEVTAIFLSSYGVLRKRNKKYLKISFPFWSPHASKSILISKVFIFGYNSLVHAENITLVKAGGLLYSIP